MRKAGPCGPAQSAKTITDRQNALFYLYKTVHFSENDEKWLTFPCECPNMNNVHICIIRLWGDRMGLLPEEIVSQRIREALRDGLDRPEGAFGDQLHIGFRGFDPVGREYLLTARTEAWMRNIDGVVHGGFCAAIADHTMGIVANCLRQGSQIAPTIQLQISYHRPLIPEAEVLVRVRVLSATARLIHLSAEACLACQPETVCFSSNATFFCKAAKN